MLGELFDAKNFAYYNRQAVRVAKRAKKQRLMKYIFGYDLVRSDFLAFDPFHDFQITPYPITARNRMVVKIGSPGYPRKRVRKSYASVQDTVLYAAAPGVNRRHPLSKPSVSVSTLESNLSSQPVIKGYVHDTTKKTRGTLSDFGEAEMFLPRLVVPSSSYSWVKYEMEVSGEDMFGPYKRLDLTTRTTSGIVARITQSTVDTYKLFEQNRFASLCNKQSVAMLPDAVPLAREFGLIREIVELKDLPQLLNASVENARNLYYNGTFNPSTQYLSQEFGWDLLVKAVLDLVSLPDKIAARINHLISRMDKKESRFKASRRETYVIPDATGFSFDPLIDETAGIPTHTAIGFANWRLVLNYGVRFPKLELPVLRDWIKSRLWGARFRPDDFYNLVPWTWLIDWFTGIGDYLEAFSSVNDETSLANYGFLTYSADGLVTSNCQGKLIGTRSTRFNSGPLVVTNRETPTNHNAVLKYRYLRRVDVTSISDISRTWVLGDLTAFQASILGALAFKR